MINQIDIHLKENLEDPSKMFSKCKKNFHQKFTALKHYMEANKGKINFNKHAVVFYHDHQEKPANKCYIVLVGLVSVLIVSSLSAAYYFLG